MILALGNYFVCIVFMNIYSIKRRDRSYATDINSFLNHRLIEILVEQTSFQRLNYFSGNMIL